MALPCRGDGLIVNYFSARTIDRCCCRASLHSCFHLWNLDEDEDRECMSMASRATRKARRLDAGWRSELDEGVGSVHAVEPSIRTESKTTTGVTPLCQRYASIRSRVWALAMGKTLSPMRYTIAARLSNRSTSRECTLQDNSEAPDALVDPRRVSVREVQAESITSTLDVGRKRPMTRQNIATRRSESG